MRLEDPPNAAIYEVTQSFIAPDGVANADCRAYAYRGMRIPSLYPGVQW